MDEDFDGLMCRVCERSDSSEAYVDLFLNRLIPKITTCAVIQIEKNDGLPRYICNKCYQDLEVAYAFRKRCEKTDAKLRSHLIMDYGDSAEEDEDPISLEYVSCDESRPEKRGREKDKPSLIIGKDKKIIVEQLSDPAEYQSPEKLSKNDKKKLERSRVKNQVTKLTPGSPGFTCKNEISRESFEKDVVFRDKVLIPILDKGGVPTGSQLNRLTRITCQYMERRIRLHSLYPSSDEQEMAAKKLLALFPQLSATRVTPDAPPESRFFWRTAGKGKGHGHYGLIYNRVRNMLKTVPPEKRKFLMRSKKRKLPEQPANESDTKAETSTGEVLDSSIDGTLC
ncbi:uncharacterized protein LOC129750558 [Uranotaenia lowii]|uniref:uncharacterized protein LOC129750558 n=1 Tax=Uranotaenia lowii TaxID=190385 RepID=UPI002478A047|nr:uncharacterized protein LOC129750558 [Uranotaenia lowii]